MHLYDSLIALGYQGGDFAPIDSLGLPECIFFCSVTAWGCQGAHNGLCDSLGWQGGDFAFSASFLILNEIMRPGPRPLGCIVVL